MLGVLLSLLAALTAAAAVATPLYTELLLEVRVNQQDTQDVALFLQTAGSDLLVSSTDLKHWQIQLPQSKAPIIYKNQAYYSLRDFAGLSYKLNISAMQIELFVPLQWLASHQFIINNNSWVAPTPSQLGGFLNYDLNAQTTSGVSQFGGLFEASLFNEANVMSSGFLLQHFSSSHNINNSAVRLNTTWVKDDPAQMHTLRVGDSFNATGMWGRAVDFGGVQWATNFAMQPSFITFPLPSAKGAAVVPSVADLYVNNALISSRAIPPGPFSLSYIPVINGQGEVSLVTTDLLGRQQITTIPYYASGQLLRPGLQDFSYEAGYIRQNYGVNSNNYAQFMLVGTHRLGFTDKFTGEWHSELLHNQQTVGIGGSYLLSTIGIVKMSLAASKQISGGAGSLALVGFEHQALHGLSLGENVQVTTRQFAQIGFQPNQPPPSMLGQSYVGIGLPDNASLAVSYTVQDNRMQLDSRLINVNYMQTLYQQWALQVSALSNVGGSRQKGIFLTLSRALSADKTVSTSAIQQDNNTQGLIQLVKNLPSGNGYGYSVLGATGSQQDYQASVSAQNAIGTYVLTAANQQNQTGFRLEGRGSVVALGEQAYLTRTITDSFGIVQIPGYPYLDIYENNQLMGHTDSKGNALIPNLLSYQKNLISIDPNQVPLNAEIGATELNVIPYYHSGLLIHFPIKPAHAAIMQLIQDSGQAVPMGAVVTAAGKTEEFPVGDTGTVYITGLTGNNEKWTAHWNNNSCTFAIQYPSAFASEVLPDLGKLECVKDNLND